MTGTIIGVVVGLAAGLLAGLAFHFQRQASVVADWTAAQARLADAQAGAAGMTEQLQTVEAALVDARRQRDQLEAEVQHLQRQSEQRAADLDEERQRLTGAFAQLSAEALQKNNEQFLALADTRMKAAQEEAKGDLAQRQQAIDKVIQPLQETLTKYEQSLRQLELDRQGAYTGLTEQVKQIGASNDQLQKETQNLVTALRAPQTRGRWGELQLRRVVEMAGMVAHCDFDEQVSTNTEDGRLRPDLVVHLPEGGQVVVDAKVPLDAFLRSVDAADEDQRRTELVAHARQVRAHVDQLAKKEYWKQFDPCPDFVVAFVPGDALLSAAYEHDSTLIEHAMEQRVFLTTPTTLIALLRTVGYGWQKEALAQNAREVQKLGAELYERLWKMGSHLGKLQKSLTSSVDAFNETVGSLESRVLVTARKFPELGVVGSGVKEIPALQQVVSTPRLTQAPELAAVESDGDRSASEPVFEVLTGGDRSLDAIGGTLHGEPGEVG